MCNIYGLKALFDVQADPLQHLENVQLFPLCNTENLILKNGIQKVFLDYK